MIVTCTIEEADRCGICDDDVTGLHAVFCRDGRIVFVLCVECLGLAVASRAQREVKRKAALEDLFTAVESYRVAIGMDGRCPRGEHIPEEGCPDCDLDRAIAAARDA